MDVPWGRGGAKHRIVFVGVLLFEAMACVACTFAPAVDKSGPWLDVSDDAASRFRVALDEARDEQNLTGLAMAIADHEAHTLWVGTSGLANVAANTSWSSSHTSRIGSVTKLFTSTLIYQLIEEGVLALDDTLESWVPNTYAEVRIEHLLGHSSGIVSYNYVGNFDTTRGWTPSELVSWAIDHEPTLRFTPGTDWEYSNTNFVLLGLVVEAATGNTYDAELDARIFNPLELESMRVSGTGEALSDDLVHCYTAGEDTSDVDPSFGWSAGSLVSNPADLARFVDALFLGEVLAPTSLKSMITPRDLTGDDETPYGLGAFVESDDEYTNWGHTGGISGYLTYAYALEDPAVTVVVMANDHGTDLRTVASHPWAVVLGVDHP